MLDLIILAGMGAVVGVAGGYAGMGGAPFLVSGLVLVLGVPQHAAQGTILAVMLGPVSLPGVWVMRDRALLLVPEIVIGVTAYALCSYIGARLAFAITTVWLQVAFGSLLVALAAQALVKQDEAQKGPLDPAAPVVGDGILRFTRPNVAIIASIIGVVGGLFGIGAGVLMVPLFISLFRLHKDDARALSLAILLPPVSLGAIPVYHAAGAIDWTAAAVIFVAYFSTNRIGARLGRAHGTVLFLRAMASFLLVLGVVVMVSATTR